MFKYFKWLLKICWSWNGAKGHIVGFGADPKGTLEAPKGTVRTLVHTVHIYLSDVSCVLSDGAS